MDERRLIVVLTEDRFPQIPCLDFDDPDDRDDREDRELTETVHHELNACDLSDN
jgi:hypothetical protein